MKKHLYAKGIVDLFSTWVNVLKGFINFSCYILHQLDNGEILGTNLFTVKNLNAMNWIEN